jgi:uncharacterized protein YbjT (DUF2867 family)
MGQRVLVAGASGVLGRAVVAGLKKKGHTVRAMYRRKNVAFEVPPDETVWADALDAASLRAAMDGMQWVFSCVGASVDLNAKGKAGFWDVDVPANTNLVTAAKAAGVTRFAYVSVFHTGLRQTRYVDAHLEVERRIAAAGLQPAIIRPVGFFSALESLLELGKKGSVPCMGPGKARSNPIHDLDLADVCVEGLENGIAQSDAGGPDVLSRLEMTQLAATASGAKVTHVPGFVPGMMSVLARPFHHRLGELLEFFGEVGKTDSVAPVRGKRRLQDHFKAVVESWKRA